MKRIILSISLIIFSISVLAQTPKYVFYFIGDGMGIAQAYFAQQYNKATGAEDINFMNFPVRTFISTFCANALVTDSAAAGTALATGEKTDSGRVGTRPDGSPIVSIAEMAKSKGFGAGVVTSVGVNHATPASFYGKVDSRNSYNDIAEQLIAHNIDFAAGGTILTTSRTEMKPADYVQKAKDAGIAVFCGKDEYDAKQIKKGQRVIYLSEYVGSKQQLPYAIDHKDGETQLADFTSAAIDYLYKNYKKGFFLMVEGGEIDGCGHSDDAAGSVREVNDMAKSIDLALDFMAKHPNETLIVVTADHETGGLTMGSGKYEMHPEFLQYANISKDELSREFLKMRSAEKEVTWGDVKAFLKEKLGFWDTIELTTEDENKLTQAYKEFFLDKHSNQERNMYTTNESIAVVAIKILDSKAMIQWSFTGHSGIPVGLYATGVKATEFMNAKDNTDVPKIIKKVAKY